MHLPIFIENSKIPVWLSYLSPINITAITLGPVVLSRGVMSEDTRRHEAIHWEQYKELLIVGFLILYLFFWVKNLLSGFNGKGAYMNIPFEKEAYENHSDRGYLVHRKRYSWWGYR
tara:strand:+ start:264 stop:611 length:348 start_codon:yes stop_codon:yes gene_type:complete